MTQQEILDAARIAIGSCTGTEYSDANLIIDLRKALIEYSRYRPLRKVGVFQTVADQGEYDVCSSYSYFTGFDAVFYTSTTFSANAEQAFYGSLSQTVLAANLGLNTVANESLRIIEDRELEYIQSINDHEWKTLERGKLHLYPAPTGVQNVYYIYKERRQVSDLHEEEFKDIVDFVFVEAATALGLKRSHVLQVNDPSSGFAMFFGGRDWLKEAKEKRTELMNKLGVRTVMTHG